jgi:hypothetical protein
MKKHILLALASVIFLLNTKGKAQDNTAFEKGTIVATVGYGFPDFYRNSLRTSYRVYRTSAVKGFGPIILKGDYGIVKFKWGHSVGAGIVLGYSSSKVDFSDTKYTPSVYYGKAIYRTITIGARGSYHFFTKEKLDCYASIGAGFNINSYSETNNGNYSYFTKNFGVYAEGGWDMSAPLQGGIALKF